MEARVISKVSRRIVPFVALCYFVCYLDRVNVGFAALQMNSDLGFTATIFGWGAGIFFFGYFFFEVPSNLALERFGARLWIARIMVTWGLLSAAMALIWNEWSFLVVRFLLGAAEAGFFPGIILFLTYWFPAEYRARMVGRFMAAIPISTVIGAPVSGLILGMDGIWGLRGWQWLFICEGLPTVLLGLVVMFYLTDGPDKAIWLKADERGWLIDRLRRERMIREAHGKHTLWEALAHPRVLVLSVVYFGTAAASYALGFWLPTIVKDFGFSNLQTGLITAIPYLVGAVAVFLWPLLSDRMHERKWNTALAFLVASGGLALSTYFPDPLHKDGRTLHLCGRPICDRAVVLDIADRVPQRHGCCRRYRANQFDRQSRRLRGTLRDGLPEGCHWRVHRRVAGRRVLPVPLRYSRADPRAQPGARTQRCAG
jgi:MFS transporter, ACS family, tartrate transporter